MRTRNTSYRRRAILNRIQQALDAFYLLQRIDWDYDIRTTLEKILATALEEIELEGGRHIERALLILQGEQVGHLEVKAGWRVEELDLNFSRTVVSQAMDDAVPILCENAKDDPRFLEAESLKTLTTLSLICVPVKLIDEVIGALYIESHSPQNIFGEEDLEFLQEFMKVTAPYIKMALVHQEHVQEIQKLRNEVTQRSGFRNIIGRSNAMRHVFDMTRLAGTVDRTVLVTGESGSGKELVARAIHYESPRKHENLVTVDCSGLAEHLLESELFGHIKGSFTGASADKKGAFEEADGGTIFLDEISDAPKSLQQKLRRVIQEREIRRVGENNYRQVDVRIICATNRSLPDLVERGEFIRDLYFRINKMPIHLPPIRERREDVPLLVQHFIEDTAQEKGHETPSITVEAMEHLARLNWTDNNVRELRNAVELSVDLCTGTSVDLEIVERALRIQRGEPVNPLLRNEQSTDTTTGSGSDVDAPEDSRGLVWINRHSFRSLIKDGTDEDTSDTSGNEKTTTNKKETPFYVIQRELAARAIVEGLRASSWKLRPAARALGISPMKLRGELRNFLDQTLLRHAGSLPRAAQELDIPEDILEKKVRDLGINNNKDTRG